MDRCAKDVHELIEYLGLEDVTLLGWSMGSSVVMEYYEQFGDEHLKKIGVIDSALYPFSPESWNSHSLAGFNMDAMTATLENALSHHDDYARTFTRLCFHTPPCQEDEDWVSTEMKKLPVYIAFALYNDFCSRIIQRLSPRSTFPSCCAVRTARPSPGGSKWGGTIGIW